TIQPITCALFPGPERGESIVQNVNQRKLPSDQRLNLETRPISPLPPPLNPRDRGSLVRRLNHPVMMLPASRSAAAMALRVKPSTTIIPFRTAAAAFSTNSRRDASALQTHSATSGLAKPRKEVPLPSEEGTKSVIQYAL
ncbi:NADH-ubiquinone oxidoreductase subunit mitochondrial precursor, partial [Fusarium albosuccineum]